MRYILFLVVLLGCVEKKNVKNALAQESGSIHTPIDTEIPAKNELLGVWTDGSGPNASFQIDEDSVFNVEHFTTTKYTYDNGEIRFHYDNEIYSSKIFKVHPDTLLFEDQYRKTKYWRFRN